MSSSLKMQVRLQQSIELKHTQKHSINSQLIMCEYLFG